MCHFLITLRHYAVLLSKNGDPDFHHCNIVLEFLVLSDGLASVWMHEYISDMFDVSILVAVHVGGAGRDEISRCT